MGARIILKTAIHSSTLRMVTLPMILLTRSMIKSLLFYHHYPTLSKPSPLSQLKKSKVVYLEEHAQEHSLILLIHFLRQNPTKPPTKAKTCGKKNATCKKNADCCE